MKLGEQKGFLEIWVNECFKWDMYNKLTNKTFKGQQPRSPFAFGLRSIIVKELAITLFYIEIFVCDGLVSHLHKGKIYGAHWTKEPGKTHSLCKFSYLGQIIHLWILWSAIQDLR